MSTTELLNGQLKLEGRAAGGSRWVVPILCSPFVIGRREGCSLHLAAEGVSRLHAEITARDGVLWIRDLGSTNGTFVNHRRLVDAQSLAPGDALQFGEVQFTLVSDAATTERTSLLTPYARQFEAMMEEKAVSPHFQPIVRFADGVPVAYEILGRAHYPGLPEGPGALFQIARKLDREIELSQLFREQAFAQAGRRGVRELLFFNLLPAEMDADLIADSLARVRSEYPGLRLAMELHEAVVTDVPMIRRLREALKSLDVCLVYDDFGSGQARLLELMEAPPDVIKFDICLIHDIDRRPEASQAILSALVRMARKAGIQTLAEGVETRQEADICRAFGFELAQGFYFGRPAPLERAGLAGGPA